MEQLARICILVSALLAGCASIPAEAPELSAELGSRITAIESSHTRLVEQFFDEKRRRVDAFVQDTWVPEFARQFFSDPAIEKVWNEVVASGKAEDRLRFVTIVGPRLQAQINGKRTELVKPLDDLERDVKRRLAIEYEQARAINNTLTSFLQSAAKVEANRKRYLESLGITDKQVDKFIDETDAAVSALVGKAGGAQDKIKAGEDFVNKLRAIAAKVKS